jgi:hypothetical protein
MRSLPLLIPISPKSEDDPMPKNEDHGFRNIMVLIFFVGVFPGKTLLGDWGLHLLA